MTRKPDSARDAKLPEKQSLLLSKGASRLQWAGALAGHFVLFLVTTSSVLAVLFIFYFITRDAVPFFFTEQTAAETSASAEEVSSTVDHVAHRAKEFFTSTEWYPSGSPPSFGAAAIFFGSGLVTLGAVLVAMPLGVAAALCLSDILPFTLRQFAKPIIEILAAIPSVAYGFFALVVLAPWLQENGGHLLALSTWIIGGPLAVLVVVVLSELAAGRLPLVLHGPGRILIGLALGAAMAMGLWKLTGFLAGLQISSGANALNASVILGIMALPTVVSVAEDALQAVGRELREGSYALGATRAETLLRVVVPAATSGICAAVILGIMRAIGETMVVWMASGNAAQIPVPWYNFLEPIRTLTATIAGDMGEADQVTGSARYHVLFAMAFCLLVSSFFLNLVSEWAVRRSRAKLRGA